MAAETTSLERVLLESRRLGFLGPGAIRPQIEHSERFGSALLEGWDLSAPLVADLGAGGGLPSLPLALANPEVRLVLVDASSKRCSFLVWAIVELGLSDRVEVWRGRAEAFAHDVRRRFGHDGVVARGFGPPATTIECAAPLLGPLGRCVVSEPPGPRSWPEAGLRAAGLRQLEGPTGFALFERDGPIDDELPRHERLRKRLPLFDV